MASNAAFQNLFTVSSALLPHILDRRLPRGFQRYEEGRLYRGRVARGAAGDLEFQFDARVI